jgi:hypothetical protein
VRYGFGCGLRIVKANRDGAVAPGIFEYVAAVGGEDGFESEAAGGVGEHAGLIAGGRGDD